MPVKKPISIRLDPEVLEWLKENSSRYQTLIQTILTNHVERERASAERRAGRAQEIFRKFYAQCFWHYKPDLVIAPSNVNLVIEGLKRYGGREGLLLAEELCL